MSSYDLTTVTSALYGAISGAPGARQWPLFRSLFRPGARLIRINGPDADDNPVGRVNVMSVEDYISAVQPLIGDLDFIESETAHEAIIVGDTASIRSDYEARVNSEAGELGWRGVNFIHFIRDSAGWRIVHLLWDARDTPSLHRGQAGGNKTSSSASRSPSAAGLSRRIR